jgi:hypothetical protein
LQNPDLDQNVIETLLIRRQTALKASAGLVLAFFISAIVIGAQASEADNIRMALSGRTAFEADKAYRPWRQFFAADGTTIYFGDGPSSIGKWDVRGNQYCSLWPPAKDWACYDVQLTPDIAPFLSVIWIAGDGSKTAAELFDGDQTALRAAPKR